MAAATFSKSQIGYNFPSNWHTCMKNFQQMCFNSFNAKNGQKRRIQKTKLAAASFLKIKSAILYCLLSFRHDTVTQAIYQTI